MHSVIYLASAAAALFLISFTQARPHGRSLWHPAGTSRENWLQCRGMPCAVWQATRNKIHKLFKDANRHEDEEPNRPTEGSLDNCIMLTEAQADWLLQQEETHRRVRRKVTDFSKVPKFQWPAGKAIRWKFDGDHRENERQIVRDAFHHWMDNTCLRFREVPTDRNVSGAHLVFTRQNTGCHSYVGKTDFQPQMINLQPICFKEFGTPVHEIGHALGLWHEHLRPDRDDHITVNWENLGKYKQRFAKVTASVSLGVPYDFSSVMHYNALDGSINAGSVMDSIDKDYQQSMGQRTGMSFLDRMAINRAYCTDVCRRKLSKPCQRGGYQDPNHCSSCICPDGFSGKYCQHVAPSKGVTCGGKIHVTPTAKHLNSPGYTNPGSYPDHQECSWLIVAPRNHRVALQFVGDFQLPGKLCDYSPICNHWVEIQYKNIGHPGPRFCCSKAPTKVFTSQGNEINLLFRSNITTFSRSERRGFRVAVKSVPAPASLVVSKCSFEEPDGSSSWCNIAQASSGDELDWLLGNGRTHSVGTGPVAAYNGQYYAYIEASGPAEEGDKAILYLPPMELSGPHCLHFRYDMSGLHIGRLEVIVRSPVEGIGMVWSKTGEQHPIRQWHHGHVNIDLIKGEKVGFVGIRGNGYAGDIALDDIELLRGSCSPQLKKLSKASFKKH